jgi:hypothetical protein
MWDHSLTINIGVVACLATPGRLGHGTPDDRNRRSDSSESSWVKMFG